MLRLRSRFGGLLGLFLAALSVHATRAQPTGGSTAAPAPVASAAARGAAADQSYVLGPEDVVEVDVLGRTDFNTRARIGQDGNIQLPYLGSVPAGNRTSRVLGQEVAKALEAGGYFSHPIVNVDIVSYASRYVTVLGSVTNPGLVPVDRPYHLSEVLARVGGVRDDGADYVIDRPESGPEKRIVIADLATAQGEGDPFVAPGDKIYVPKAQLFYISGEVKAPGAYAMMSGMTLRMAISRGGGVTDLGSDRRVKVTRAGHAAQVALDGKIEPGDVIVVGERLF